eukprot:361195-Chlamydomonas_euryale.AAC.2
MRSSAARKFCARSSISAHSAHTCARSSTYLNEACRAYQGGLQGVSGCGGTRVWRARGLMLLHEACRAQAGRRAGLDTVKGFPGASPSPYPSFFQG